MKKPDYIIFDLSEVLIMGLLGIEKNLQTEINISCENILNCFNGSLLEEILSGKISEDEYLNKVVKRNNWEISTDKLKFFIRENFKNEIPGSIQIMKRLSENFKLVLLSDHAAEWVDYIKKIHSFFIFFERTYFSYEFGFTKKNSQIFNDVLSKLQTEPENCLFIDDNSSNIQNAIEVGIPSIHFKSAYQLFNDLKKFNII